LAIARERHLLAIIADLKRENAQLRLALNSETTPTAPPAATTTATMLNGLSSAPKSLPVASTYTPPSLFAPLADSTWPRTIF
jgi:hypothetical protein